MWNRDSKTLSTTARGDAWLKQFDSDDRLTASRLLDAIRLASRDEVVRGLRQNIERCLEGELYQAPVALVPVMSIEDLQPLNGQPIASKPIVYQDFDPSQRLSGSPGSEALIAHLIRDIRRSSEFSKKLVEFPVKLDTMRKEKVRTLMCVTDYIGSGSQVLKYVDAWHRNPTIRSWRSYGLLKIVVVTFAATSTGLHSVQASSHIDDTILSQTVPGIDEVSRLLDLPKAEELCRVYARRHRFRRNPLGYLDTGGLFASSFSVPNNLPAIFVCRANRWNPFFEGRSMPSSIDEGLSDLLPRVEVERQLSRVRESRLASRSGAGELDPRWSEWIYVLALLPTTDEHLVTLTGKSLAEVIDLRRVLEQLRLIDEGGKKTTSGRAVLHHARKKPRYVTAHLQSDPSPYYPRLKR